MALGKFSRKDRQDAKVTVKRQAAVSAHDNGDLPFQVAQAVNDMNNVLLDISRHIVANDHIIKLTGIALTAGTNIFLHGLPGISKTMLCKLLAARFNGKFHRALYGPYLEPEAIFGSIDVNGFMKGEYIRHREGTILDSNIHFGDEFLESNDAMKKAMLGLFDETPTYEERGKTEYLENLLLVITASNRLPGKEDAAIADRLVFQVPVTKPPEREDRLEILKRHAKTYQGLLSTEPQVYISVDQIKLLRQYARQNVEVPEGIYEKLVSLDDDITEKLGVYVSPRTLNRCLDILKAVALLGGRSEVGNKDFWALQYVVAPIPHQDRARDIILDLVAPLEKEALEIIGAISREVGEWRALANSSDKRKKAQAKKGGQDVLNSVIDYQAALEQKAEQAEREGYDSEVLWDLVEQVKAQSTKVQMAIRQLYSDLRAVKEEA